MLQAKPPLRVFLPAMAVLMIWLAHSVSPMLPPPAPMAAWRIAVAVVPGCVLLALAAYLARARTYVLIGQELRVRPWWAKKPGVVHALHEMRSVGFLAAGVLRVPMLEVEFRSGKRVRIPVRYEGAPELCRTIFSIFGQQVAARASSA